MTSDFKDKIFKYLTGNYTIGSGVNTPQFGDVTSKTNDFQTKFNVLFPNGYFITGNLQGQDSNNNGNGFSLIYGLYYVDDTGVNLRGFIVILDEDFDIIQTITQYSSGTNFGLIELLSVGDDGYFYGIENNNGTKRFIMLNNILAKLPSETNYQVVLRQSYNLSGQSANITSFVKVLKAPSQSKYLICGNNDADNAIATELTIVVGGTNSWIDYTYTANRFTIGDAFASWDSSGNLIFKLAGFTISSNVNLTYGELYANSTQGQTLTLTSYGSQINSVQSYSVSMNNFNETYVTYTTTNYTEDDMTLKVLNYTTSTFTTLSENYPTHNSNWNFYSFHKIGEETFVFENYVGDDGLFYSSIGKLVGNNLYIKEDLFAQSSEPSTTIFTVQKQFNLYNYFIQIDNVVYNVKQIYNDLNYNGIAYQGLNSMIPNSVQLLSNNLVIFARNLYNRVVNNNTTISTLDVPNSYINDVTISNENLYGMTNNLLNSNATSITTNVYEELMINFINTITISNQNDSSNYIENLTGASRLNKSISSTLDYSNCYIGKYKINYSDNTSLTNDLDTNLTYVGDKTTYTIMVYVPNDKTIKNVQLLSNDGNTVYQTIDCSNLENNKYYVITQDVRIS